MKKLLTLITFFILQLSLFTAEVMAQAPPPSNNPPGAPLDGVAGLLLAAGAVYSWRHLAIKEREKEKDK